LCLRVDLSVAFRSVASAPSGRADVPDDGREIILGVDTHEDEHVAALVDELGRLVATRSFAASADGFQQLLAWARAHGSVCRAGVKGTGSFGAGLARFLAAEGVGVIEVTRPNRRGRRHLGNTDTVDADVAARWCSRVRRRRPRSGASTRRALRSLARRWQQLNDEVRELERELHALVRAAAPSLLAAPGVGPDTPASCS
jgi:transposase